MLIQNVGLQLYSLRDAMQADFKGTVAKVAEMGYKGVEFAGYGGLKPAEMAQLLKDNGLTAYGSHTGGLPKTDAELDAEIEMNLAVGNPYLVCPWQTMATHDDALRFAETMNETYAKLKPHGLKLGYHNHAHEFVVDGGEVLMDTVLSHVDPEIFMEFDVFWVAYAGYDPLRYIRKYAGRQPLMHLKELGPDRKANVELGAGVLDFDAIVRLGQEIGTEHFIIEQEEYTLPPIDSCKVSLDTLLKL
ncbi:MAG: sugar phosphate isomerase/epimerase [Clostridia bacterium]|nr:sugar phosphate isomerase/epimerase [Clostridia bacterium]